MCDYSLHGIENRLAVQGETLVVYRFPMGSKGLTSPAYLETPKPAKGFTASLAKKLMDPSPVCAVCIPDGAKLVRQAFRRNFNGPTAYRKPKPSPFDKPRQMN
jgi:hypothetical protein